MVIVDEPPEVTDGGLNDALAPLGTPLADSDTVCALPEVVAVLTVALVEPPAVTAPEPGETEMEKSLPAGALTTKRSLFGEPVPGLTTTPLVALLTRKSRTCCGVKPGLAAATRAAAPATCGVAIEVPLMVLVAVSLVIQDEVMLTPGAKMSTQVPKLENEARLSLMSVAPTVIAAGTRAGLKLQALALLLPAAMAYVTPELIELATALSNVVSMPAATCAVVPLPLQFRTRTATSCTPLATPYCDPPTVPATCVPWPLQSSAVPPSISSTPLVARPPKVWWVNRIPVSMM